VTTFYANYGDWRKLFTELEDYDKVTAEDVERVAKTYLVPEHRTVAWTFAAPEEKAAGGRDGARGGAPEGEAK
jgi:predicted Zn-dependent peptidase